MPAARKTNPEESPRPRRRPAVTLDARENQMISLAVDLAEKQLREGTASAQVVTHFLRLGTSRERLEQEKLAKENELLKGRTDQLASTVRIEELYAKALNSMMTYSGKEPEQVEDDDY